MTGESLSFKVNHTHIYIYLMISNFIYKIYLPENPNYSELIAWHP